MTFPKTGNALLCLLTANTLNMHMEMQNVIWLDSGSTKRDCTAELTQPFVLVLWRCSAIHAL